MRFMRKSSIALGLCISMAAALLVGSDGAAQALVTTSQPQLSLNRLVRTSPFTGSSTSVRDNEDTAYVASDDSLWIADDNGNAIYEINRATGALRRVISQSAFTNSRQFGGSNTAGKSRTEDLEALAYDANADVLYAFSGSTSATPTVYKLARDGNHQFQIQSWRPMASEWTGAGWRLADGKLYVANDATFRTYSYDTDTFGSSFSISGLSKVFDVAFDDVTGDLLAVNSSQRLYRASMSTRTLLSGWNGINLAGLGFLDTRGVAVIGQQLFISDGYDYRSSSDPMNHAVFVLDVTGPGGGSAPTAGFTATPTTGTAPLPVSFTNTSTGSPTSWAWTFGDGATSNAQSPSHTYTATGSFTATLTATNNQGSDSTSRTITVTTTPTVITLALDADTYVNSPSPTKNYGDSPVMKLHSPTSEYRPLVRFTVAGLGGAPSSVKLRLFVADGSTSGGDWFAVASNWIENSVTWNNKPAISGGPAASVGVITTGTWVEIDLTSAIAGNGTYSFMATSTASNTAQFSSSQGTNAPQVVITP